MKCSKTGSEGWTCQAEALSDSIYCFMHDDRPQTVAKRAEARSRGGRTTRSADAPVDIPIDLSSPGAILDTLQATARAVVAGEIDRSRANAVGYLAKTAGETIRALQHERRLRKVEELLKLRDPDETEGA